MLTVRVDYDMLTCPIGEGLTWTLYSFSPEHRHYLDPADLGLRLAPKVRLANAKLARALRQGFAFWLRNNSGGGRSVWMRDHYMHHGILVWENSRIALDEILCEGTYAARAACADKFLAQYMAWANSEGLSYTIRRGRTYVRAVYGCYGYADAARAIREDLERIRLGHQKEAIVFTGPAAETIREYCIPDEAQENKRWQANLPPEGQHKG